jgi:Flp pilus assembly pilin Flp
MAPGTRGLPSEEETDPMLKLIRNFVRDERGEDLIEYGLLAAFVAAVGVIIVYTLGLDTAIQDAFTRAINSLNQVG